jgi:hypothetical protein
MPDLPFPTTFPRPPEAALADVHDRQFGGVCGLSAAHRGVPAPHPSDLPIRVVGEPRPLVAACDVAPVKYDSTTADGKEYRAEPYTFAPKDGVNPATIYCPVARTYAISAAANIATRNDNSFTGADDATPATPSIIDVARGNGRAIGHRDGVNRADCDAADAASGACGTAPTAERDDRPGAAANARPLRLPVKLPPGYLPSVV